MNKARSTRDWWMQTNSGSNPAFAALVAVLMVVAGCAKSPETAPAASTPSPVAAADRTSNVTMTDPAPAIGAPANAPVSYTHLTLPTTPYV